MQNWKRLILAALLLVNLSLNAQWGWEKIEGNGQIKKENRASDNFTAISSAGSWDVMVAYGNSCSIQVEGDENLIAYIETKVENGKLSIKNKKNANLHSKNKIVIYLTLSKLTDLSLSGSGDIMGEGKFVSDGPLNCRLSGSGSIKMAIEKSSSVECAISGSGNIELTGNTDKLDASISGSGNMNCSNLYANSAKARISGSGNIKVFANKSIDASISGSGNVIYKGAPEDIQKKVAGSGKLVKAS
jgi:hypothetical protein